MCDVAKEAGEYVERNPCPRCAERGDLGEHFCPRTGKCAFPGGGDFRTENWNCATANALRDRVDRDAKEPTYFYSDDQYAGVLPWNGCFIVLGWYKHRGRTEGAWLLTDTVMHPLTYADADTYLRSVSP